MTTAQDDHRATRTDLEINLLFPLVPRGNARAGVRIEEDLIARILEPPAHGESHRFVGGAVADENPVHAHSLVDVGPRGNERRQPE